MRKILIGFVTMLFFSILAFGQTTQVTGKVTDANGAALPNASVRVKGAKGGVSSSADGTFSISVKAGSTLVISEVGFETKEVAAASNVVIALATDTKNLNEVVVTALGIRRQPKQLGYSTAVVNTKDLTQASVTNIASGLSGKVAGVNIRLADNSVNPNIQITLRGNRSIAGSNAALIVIDGIIVDQQFLASLDPEDIENVTILKGANAAALYGKDASNGVMILTTKKGRKGKISVTYKNSTMFNTVSYMPKLQYQYSPNGGEGGEYIDPLTGMPLPVPYENQNFGPAYDSKDFPYTQIAIGYDSLGNFLNGPYQGYKNGRKDFFQTGLNEQNNISFSGANNWGSFYASYQNASNSGIILNDKSIRNTGSLSGTVKFGNFSAEGKVSYSNLHVDQAGLVYGGGTQYRPVYWSVINQPPNIDLKTVQDQSNYYNTPSGYINQYYTNPWYQVFHSRAIQNRNTLSSSLSLNYKFTDWLSFTVRSGYNKTTNNAPAHIDGYTYSTYAQTDPLGAGGTSVSAPTTPYQSELVKINYDDWINDGFFTVKKKVSDFDFTLLAGGNFRQQNSQGYWYSNQATSTLNVPTGINKVNNADGSASNTYAFKYRSQAYLADLTVGYDNWLFIHGSFRNDWLSILDPQTRSFSYGGVDLSAVLSDKLSLLKTSNLISYLKVRAGYSITGNVSIPSTARLGFLSGGSYGLSMPTFGAYGIYPEASVAGGFPYGTLNGYSQSYTSVQNGLKPEKDASTEVGFELGLLHDKIRFEASYYSIGATNQTVTKGVSGATGNNTGILNTGKIQDNGLELDLKLTPLLKFGKFNWNVGVNFSLEDIKVAYLTKGVDSGSLVLAGAGSSVYNIDATVGKAFPSLYVSDWNRDPSGHIIVDARTGLPSANPNLVYAGNTQYKNRLGITSGMNYGRLSFNFVIDYRGGAKMINTMGSALDFAGISATSAQNRQHFVVPNSVISDGNGKYITNTNTPITGSLASWWSTTYNAIGAPYVVSAAFWKLREVNIGYDIPVKALGIQSVFKRLTFSLVGQNLLMIRPKTNQWTDPEFSSSINTNSNAVGAANEYITPPTRSFGFSLSATL